MSQRVCHRGQSSQSVCPLMGAHSEGHLGGLTVPALFTFFPPPSPLLLQSQLSWPTMRENKEFLSVAGPSDMSQSRRENSHWFGSRSTNWKLNNPPRGDVITTTAEIWACCGDRKLQRCDVHSKSVGCSVCLTGTQRGGTFLMDSFLALNQSAPSSVHLTWLSNPL